MKRAVLLLTSPLLLGAWLVLAAQEAGQQRSQEEAAPEARVQEETPRQSPDASREGEKQGAKKRGKKACDYRDKKGDAETTSRAAA